jgi:PqqD family protein of HPr-rel-A system
LPAESTSDELVWGLAFPTDLLYEWWNGDIAVFCHSTGETHLLSVLPGEILLHLLEGPCRLSDLTRLFAAECGVDDSVEWRRKISALLSELRSLELLEQRQ